MNLYNNISFYIHIPFCYSKCYYCTFNSYPVNLFSHNFIEEYVKKVINQIVKYKEFNFCIESIYIGGGTPSIIDENLIFKIVDNIVKNFKISKNCEITIEANPESINKEKVKVYNQIGINRISIGIQSFNNKFLKILGRPHTLYHIEKAIEISKKYFKNISFDLIFGIPNQTVQDLKSDLNYVKKFSPTHVSYYSLTIEEGSMFFKNKIKEINDKTFSEMYDLIVEFLESNQLFQYEISNFSEKNFECKHNLRYWNYKEYIGFGAGAVSFFNKFRWRNISNPIEFIKFPEKKEYIEKLNEKIMEFEYIFMNLRKKDGLNFDEFKDKFNCCFLKKYNVIINKLSNFFEITKNKISLNREGFKVSNLILSEFL